MFKKLNKNNKPFKTTASNGPLSLINRANLLFKDTFTDTDGVTLNNHTPDIDNATGGAGWFRQSPDFEIVGNMATNRITDPVGLISAATMVGINDYIVTSSVQWNGTGNGTQSVSIRARGPFEIGTRAAGDIFAIVESGVLRASTPVSLSVDTAYTIRAVCNGLDIDATLDGGNDLSYGAAANNDEVGIWTKLPTTATRAVFWDWFTVERVM